MNVVALIELTAAVVGCTTDGPHMVRQGRRFFRRPNRLRSVQPVESVVSLNRAVLLALLRDTDEFRNSTAHEEYRG